MSYFYLYFWKIQMRSEVELISYLTLLLSFCKKKSGMERIELWEFAIMIFLEGEVLKDISRKLLFICVYIYHM